MIREYAKNLNHKIPAQRQSCIHKIFETIGEDIIKKNKGRSVMIGFIQEISNAEVGKIDVDLYFDRGKAKERARKKNFDKMGKDFEND